MKIVTIVGARPQFIKAAVISRALARHNRQLEPGSGKITEVIVHTGQHYDHSMSQVFFDELEIPKPDYNLAVGSGRHGQTTGAMLNGIEEVLIAEKPDEVLVYGDTNSTLAGALAAVKLHIPVAHVEAGLRSFNKKMPEEINRVLTDHVSTTLFCPTRTAVENLAREGIAAGVHLVGDVMCDAALYYRHKTKNAPYSPPFVLASLHRAENTDDPQRLRNILSALNQMATPVLLPLHPRTCKVLETEGIVVGSRVNLLNPVSYLEMLSLLDKCEFVVTDSGGLQKEAFFFRKRCLTIRDETEWIELVACGANKVVGADEERICREVAWASKPLAAMPPLYGTGKAGESIVAALSNGC